MLSDKECDYEDDENRNEFHVNGKAVEGRCNIRLDFHTAQDMADWLVDNRGFCIPEDVSLFVRDGLDYESPSFVLRRDGDRPDDFQLKVVSVDIENV
jgi:hypothetical protein